MTDEIIEAVRKEYRTFAIVGVTKDGKYSDCYAPTSVPYNMQERMKSAIRTADKKMNQNNIKLGCGIPVIPKRCGYATQGE